jgi:sugar lactone lactonase YvrE
MPAAMGTQMHAGSANGCRFPNRVVGERLGPLFLASAVLLGMGCQGRTGLPYRVPGTGIGGAVGENPGTTPNAGAGGSNDARPDARRDGAVLEVADAGRDTPPDAALDGAVEVRSDIRSEAGRPDTGNTADSGGWLKLVAGGMGGSGSVDGIGPAARFLSPRGMATDKAGNLFVADSRSHTLRKVVIATGEVTTLAGSPGQLGSSDGIGGAARFAYPDGVVSDRAGNLFVTDSGNYTIRKVVVATGEVTTLAGSPGQTGSRDGTGAAARFDSLHGIASDGAGSLFATDMHAIRKVVLATGEVTTLAGSREPGSSDGTGAAARFLFPFDVASAGTGLLFVADQLNHTIRKVVLATGEVTTVAGSPGQSGSSDGTGAAARFHFPRGIASDEADNLFVADDYNHTIRKVVLATGEVTTVAGSPGQAGSSDGIRATARFSLPLEVASDGAGHLFVTEGDGCRIRKVVIATGEVTTLAGSSAEGGSSDGTGATAQFYNPSAVASDGAGSLFVVDTGNHTLRKVVLATGEATTFAGSPGEGGNSDGTRAAARFYSPNGVASDGAGSLFVADSRNHTIRKLVIATGEVATLAGSPGAEESSDGIGAAAAFRFPYGVAVDGTGNLFVADSHNHTIRKVVIATGEVTTLAGSPRLQGSSDGTGTAARFAYPSDVASDRAGNLFVADEQNHTIRKIVMATGAVTTLAGSPGIPGSANGVESAARFNGPKGVVSDGGDSLFVADTGNHTIRRIAVRTGAVTTVVGSPERAGVVLGPLPAGLNAPRGLALGQTGELVISDVEENSILVARF